MTNETKTIHNNQLTDEVENLKRENWIFSSREGLNLIYKRDNCFLKLNVIHDIEKEWSANN